MMLWQLSSFILLEIVKKKYFKKIHALYARSFIVCPQIIKKDYHLTPDKWDATSHKDG